ncbi:hypothetical protein [Kitasatospora griseola]|uniref:hypothetical protein n=1 Tax=Kitasatospora griseola TaxID=2064 RepID=UPI003419D195
MGAELDWRAPHTLNTATLSAGTSTLTAACLTYLTGLNPWWDLAVAGGGALGAVVAGLRSDAERSTRFYRASLWLAAGGWAAWAAATGPLSPSALAALAAGLLLGRATWPATTRRDRAAKTRRSKEMTAKDARAQQEQHNRWGQQWAARIKRVANIDGCRIVGIQPWTGNTGYSVEVLLPTGGVTWKQLKANEEGFGSDLRLPEGCGVEVGAGRAKGSAIIRVSTVNVMGQDLPFPMDLSPTSIDHPFEIGRHRDGSPTLGSLAYICGLGIGDTGSGKTNTLGVINAQLLRTVDAIVWHIDTTGSGLALPWLTSWALDGAYARPVIDWVAPTHDEARAMLKMAIQVIAQRKTRYQRRMREANDTKLPVGPDVPEILIVVDETADLPNDIKADIVTVQNTGRAVRVRVLISSLRATSDSIPVPMKKRSTWRWGMFVTDPEELSYLFTGYQQVDPSDAPWPGCGFNAYETTKPRPFKAYYLDPRQMDAIAIGVWERRPLLDKISTEVEYGKYYPSRWARTLPLLYPDERLAPVTVPYTSVTIVPVPSASTPTGPNDTFGPGPSAVTITKVGTGQMVRPGSPEFDKLFPAQAARQRREQEAGTAPAQDAPAGERPAPPQPGAGGLRLVVDNSSVSRPAPQAGPEPQSPTSPQPGGPEHDGFAPPAGPPAPPEVPVVIVPVPAPAAPPVAMPTPQDAAMALVLDAGPNGTGASRLEAELQARGYPTVRTTISGWLNRWAAQGEIVRRGTGTQVTYVHRSYVPDHGPGRR